MKNINIKSRIAELSAIPNQNGYTREISDNILPTISPEDFKTDLENGNGNELENKFKAIYSSSALAVNFFGIFKRCKCGLTFENETDFTDVQFEKKLATGLKGTSPNLDFFMKNTKIIIGVESKFLELLTPKKASFSDSYSEDFLKKIDKNLPALLKHYKENDALLYLDAAQLIKHSIGLINNKNGLNAKLVYVYWQPENANDFPIYAQHKSELEYFSERIKIVSGISFTHYTYLELYDIFKNFDCMKKHLEHFKKRYLISL